VKSVGPSYVEVADRYRKTKDADTALIKKVMQGGGGVWGAVPMPPNPQYNEEQVNQMIDAILALEPIEHKE
jgi:cytochrome c